MSNFHPLEVEGCASETQVQVDKNLNYLIWPTTSKGKK